jgi:hypothetical protein
MKKVLVAFSLVFFLSAGMISAADFQSSTTVDYTIDYSVVMADDDATVNAFVDGDDEKDKKKKSKDAKCCDKGKDAKCASSAKKCCDTKKSCSKDGKAATKVEDKDGK